MLEPQTECTCTCSQSAMLEPQTDSKKHSSCSQSAMLEPQTDCKKTLLCRKRLGHRHHVMCSTILEPQTEKTTNPTENAWALCGRCETDTTNTKYQDRKTRPMQKRRVGPLPTNTSISDRDKTKPDEPQHAKMLPCQTKTKRAHTHTHTHTRKPRTQKSKEGDNPDTFTMLATHQIKPDVVEDAML